ncbi:hypothetical protein [Aquibacillus rhizosphaerae]|uniref:Superinfection exclusion protein B n=1 Tax=Aquibacillus rhizosphaerae TaxID=3051431 RepID=A0ABT7L1I8_9BACI|nr:hypothetical protein [Aquibacillus sp. LR5S19]MDL4839239.1 hypothetical protein [Aquibacillus sp. LR5S19]
MNDKLEKNIETFYSNYKSSHNLPKFSLTAVSTVFSIIWLFPSQISEHPILGSLIEDYSTYFNILWFYSIMLTVVFWISIYQREQKQKTFLSMVNTESYQNEMFSNFIRKHQHLQRQYNENNLLISKEQFINYLIGERSYNKSRSRFFFFRPRELDIVVAQSITEIVFSRAEEKGIIKKIDTKSLLDQYEIETEFLTTFNDRNPEYEAQ